MPPYLDNKALPIPTLTLPDTFIFNFLIISFIFVENKCLSGTIWDLERDWQKVYSNSSKSMHLTIYPTETDAKSMSFLVLTNPITC